MDNFYSLIEQYFGQIIGVIGTLLGVMLGALLNRISRFGRVKFYVNSVIHQLTERDFSGGFKVVSSVTPSTERLSIIFELDVINTSDYSKKILRGINFFVVDKKFKIKKNILDNSTRRTSNHSTSTDDLRFINLKAKEVKTLNLSVHFNKDFNKDFEKILSSNWLLEYRNQRNVKHKVYIKKNKKLTF